MTSVDSAPQQAQADPARQPVQVDPVQAHRDRVLLARVLPVPQAQVVQGPLRA